jgi:hypothetical protein
MTTTPAAFHFVAPVTVKDGELTAHTDDGKISVRITDAVDRIVGGMHPGNLYAVWEFEERPNPAQAATTAQQERPARILVHPGHGELLQLADRYRLDLTVKEF